MRSDFHFRFIAALVLSLAVLALSCSVAAAQGAWTGNQDFVSHFPLPLNSEQISNGWISLFDGRSLFGWRQESDVNWIVEEGAVVARSGSVGLLRTSVQFDDFEMRLEFQATEQTNSGVFIRSSPKPLDPRRDCLEINIAPADNPFPTGSIVGHHKSAVAVPVQTWNEMTIKADGPRVSVSVNGQQTIDFNIGETYLQRGYIGLQFNSGEVRFRKIVVRPLNLPPIIPLSAANQNAWRVMPDTKGNFQVSGLYRSRQTAPGKTAESDSIESGKSDRDHLRVSGGRGQLETKSTFGDFALSAHLRSNRTATNSGIFFRCIPNQMMNGYESQIDHQYENGDRSRPIDCGTGGIFARQVARFVNADDRHWFAKTIIANGATFAIWVNGLQVVDWTDHRQPHANPRRGLRLEAGTILIQGHDANTDLSIKSLSIRELFPRKATQSARLPE